MKPELYLTRKISRLTQNTPERKSVHPACVLTHEKCHAGMYISSMKLKKNLLARVLCKKAFCTVYLSLKFCFCVCSYQNDKNCCIGTCISPMHNIMISPLGSKWSLGTNENKDRAQ